MPDNKSSRPQGSKDPDEQWEDLLASHKELTGLENSHAARRFERAARRRERREVKHLLDAKSLPRKAFKRGRASRGGPSDGIVDGPGHGPRDFETSILDVDSDGPFTPGERRVGRVRLSTLIFTLTALAGLALFVVSLFAPLPQVVAGLSGLLLIVGGAGLFHALGAHKKTRGPGDTGARV